MAPLTTEDLKTIKMRYTTEQRNKLKKSKAKKLSRPNSREVTEAEADTYIELMERRQLCIEIESMLKKEHELINSMFKTQMIEQGCDEYTLDHEPLVWLTEYIHRSTQNLEEMKEKYPEVYATYVTEKETKRINFAKLKED